jgi:hypothetical protein
MSKKWITILVAAVVGALLLPSAAMAACQVAVVDNLTVHDSTKGAFVQDPVPYTAGDKIDGLAANVLGALTVNKEGVTERVADLLITDNGALPFCFTTGNDLVITYNAILTVPTTPGNLAIPANLDIYDSNGIGGLTVTSATVSTVFAANTTNSQLDIKIGQTGTTGQLGAGGSGQVGAALRVKNIRVNAAKAGATIAATFLGITNTVANSLATVGVIHDPTTAGGGAIGAGTQSSGKGLATAGKADMTEGFGVAFRTAGGTCNDGTTAANDTCYSGVANDIATVATSMTFSVTGIPSGVTVTFPTSMSTSVADGADALLIAARAGATLTNSGAPGAVTVTYDTKHDTVGVLNKLAIETADNADFGTAGSVGASSTGNANPNCIDDGTGLLKNLTTNGSLCDPNPKIGVKVASVSGAGTANLWWVFGPADVGTTPLFTGDDVAADATVIPRYTGAGRTIVNNKNFFVITPTRTTLLFPFVSTVGNFNTGISIVNTCTDTGVFGTKPTCTTEGGVTLFFFGVNTATGAAVTDSLNSDLTASGSTNLSTACRGLDATTGHVKAGTGMACSVAALLPLLASKPAGFDGYVIAVTGFNFGHGFSAQFSPGGPFAANEALILAPNGATARPGGEILGF